MAGVLDGRVAVITGGGTGIGAATARLFAREGAAVVLAGRRRQLLDSVAGETGGLAVVCDVADEDSVAALFRTCQRTRGRLDVLVNNAGYGGPEASAEDTDLAEWDKTIAVNTRGVILCIKHAIPLLKRQGGAIVNVASRMGLQAKPMKSAYAASKFAVVGITESVAQEVGVFGIRVNTVCPGGTDTEMLRDIVAERARQRGVPVAEVLDKGFVGPSALKRIVKPEEVAEAILFLASPHSGAITGTHLRIDAGRP